VTVATVVHGATLWYLTRGTGVVSLLLLTASVVLGVGVVRAWRTARWPRFATAALHRTLSLLAVCFVAVHVGTTVLDAYAPVKLVDAVVPFGSAYRPVWLGLGAVAFDLLLALVVTSLLRVRLGFRAWRLVHLLAYACWPLALVHAAGTGSDARLGRLAAVCGGCVAAVLAALAVRLRRSDAPPRVRLAVAASAAVGVALLGGWYATGPLQRGWARRAGTPVSLLRHAATVRAAASVPAPLQLPRSFAGPVAGSVVQRPDAAGETRVVIRGHVAGPARAAFRIDLRGEAVPGGVAMTASGVSFVPAGGGAYLGSVTALAGTTVDATARSGTGGRLRLRFLLRIDQRTGAVSGTVRGSSA
jgi:DMSO/TMAO reductase YedYZ heme-binding membrane subunit